MAYSLQHPEYLTFSAPDGTDRRGADQRWFSDQWQRRAGCGPTTAAVLLAYLAATRRELGKLGPGLPRTAAEFLPYMEEVWRYVLPGSRGLDDPEGFLLGCRSFAFSRGLHLTGAVLPLPERTQGPRPSLAWCRDFVFSSLTEDRPLAFLNYSSGEVSALDDWHWVPVVAAEEEGGRLFLLILDGGEEKAVDFTLWWNTSLAGGALVTVAPLEKHLPYTLRTEGTAEDFLCGLTAGGEELTVRLERLYPPEHWLVSWPCASLHDAAYVLTGLTRPKGRTGRPRARALLSHAVQTARERGGRALRLSIPAGEKALAEVCRELGFRPAEARTGESPLCYLEKEL